mgnify:CR=1 FL=1
MLSTLSHSTLCESEGPVLFVKTGWDSTGTPTLVVFFSRILVVWVCSNSKSNKSNWTCVCVGEASPTWSLLTTIVDGTILPQCALSANGARFAVLSFQQSGDSKRHVLFQKSSNTTTTTTSSQDLDVRSDDSDAATSHALIAHTTTPMLNEMLRPGEKNTHCTKSCACGDTKLIVGTSTGSVQCWEMTPTWDRVLKVHSFNMTSSRSSTTSITSRPWSVSSIATICGCRSLLQAGYWGGILHSVVELASCWQIVNGPSTP